MQLNSKLKKPRIRLLQPYIPREYFDTLQHTLDRHSKPHQQSENVDSQTINVQQPFRRKTQDRTLAGQGAQLNVQKVAAYLEKKITANELNNRRPKQQLNLRYDDSEEGIRRNPYSKSKVPDRRQSLLNKSHKMRSGSIANNHSPSLHRHPKSSLSNPYEIQKHRRVVSISRNYLSREEPDEPSVQSLLELGRRYYKQSRLDKAIESFKRLLQQKKLVEAQYLLGVCYMNSSEFQKGINVFYEIMDEQPDYRKNVYLLTAIAYKKLDKLDSATAILSRGLKAFPEDYDCLVYRAKLHMRMNEFQRAADDFLLACRQAPTKGFSYIGRADCLKSIGMLDEAILALTEALQTDLVTIAYLKRGVCYYEQGNYPLALSDFSAHLQRDSSSSEALYYKAMVYLKQNNISEALLNFDETVKLDNNQAFVSKAVEEILKIRISQKDFYEAYHMVARADNLDIDKQFVEDWKCFIEGTLLLMKKKHKEGVESLTLQLQKPFFNQPLYSVEKQLRNKYIFLKPLLHLYRAFGYFSQSDLASAKNDYHQYDCFYDTLGSQQSEPSKEYNVLLIKAVEQFPIHSKQWLEEAIQLYPYKTEPYLYLALAEVQEYISTEDAEIIDRVRVHLDKAVNFLPQLSNNHISNVYYHRAVINLYVNDFDKAVADVDKAIEKSEDNIPRYFYLRGLIFACCGNFSQAVQDLSVAINLDENFAKAFLERAKCLQMEGNPNEAFLDLQKYITLRPEDPLIHKYAGFLLFQNCAYEDCLSAFSHGSELLSDVQILQAKGKCHFLLGDLSSCLECLEKYPSNSKDPAITVDQIVINMLKSLEQNPVATQYAAAEDILNKIIYSKTNEGKFFKQMDLHLLLAASLASRGHFQKAISEFQTALKFKARRKDEAEKNMPVEDSDEDDSLDFGWSTVQASYCIVLCHLALGEIQPAKYFLSTLNIKEDNEDDSWLVLFRKIIRDFESQQTFTALNQLNRAKAPGDRLLSRFFLPLPIKLADGKIVQMEMRFSSPQLDPPELLPEFDHELLMQFLAKNIECKPEAPWITRNSNGVVFTTNVQVFDNLELSASSATKKHEESAQMEQSVPDLSERMSEIKIDKKNLKDHFKLDEQTQQKLKRLLESKAKN